MYVIDEFLDELPGVKFFFKKIDMASGFHQIRMTDGCGG